MSTFLFETTTSTFDHARFSPHSHHPIFGKSFFYLIRQKTIKTLDFRYHSYIVVNALAIRQVKQGTETTVFRIGFTLHLCQYVSS